MFHLPLCPVHRLFSGRCLHSGLSSSLHLPIFSGSQLFLGLHTMNPLLLLSVTFHNTLEIILTNPNRPQCYGTQYNDLNSQSTSCPTPTKHRTHVGDSSSTSKSSCHPSDSQDNLMDPGPNTDCLPGHCHHLDTW